MDPSSTPSLEKASSKVLVKADPPVLATIATKKAQSLDFDVNATFKLSNIKQYFEDDHAAALPSLYTPFFGPHLRLGVYPSTLAPRKSIAVALDATKLNPLLGPMSTQFSIDFSADAEGVINLYRLKLRQEVTNAFDIVSWRVALPLKVWEAQESLRRANAVYLLVKVVGSLSQTQTSRSSHVLDLLHETIVDVPRSVIRFTASDRRNAVDKDLTHRRVLLANRDIIQDTCTVLYNILTRQAQWEGLHISDALERSHDQVIGSKIPESDSDLEDSDSEDGDEADTENLTNPSSSSVGLNEREQTPSQGSVDSEIKHASGNDTDAASAGRDSQNVESAVVEDVDSHGSNTEYQMQIDGEGRDNRVMKGQATQTDPWIETSPDPGALNVVVVGAAAATWEAFIFYLYTGNIEFAPLSSNGRTERNAYVQNFDAVKRPKPCSPKSIYRVADKMDQAPLKQLALKEIIEELSVDNILSELFCSFTSEYEVIEEQELLFFTQHRDEIMKSQAFKDLMVDIAMGTYRHAGRLLGKLFERVVEDSHNAGVAQGFADGRANKNRK